MSIGFSDLSKLTMPFSYNRSFRRIHRVGAILFAIPLLLVIVSGVLLQLKKQVTWVQPPTMKGSTSELKISWEQILSEVKKIPDADVQSWDDIGRIDARPNRGLIKIRCKNNWEVQLDSSTAKVLSSRYRRSDWIESLHDGSFFSEWAKPTVFLANGLILLCLWLTGIYLWFLPIRSKMKQKKRLASKQQ